MTEAERPLHVMWLGAGFDLLFKARAPLMRALLARGYRVTAMTPGGCEPGLTTLKAWGVEFAPLGMRKTGLNPFADLRYFAALLRQMRASKPDVLMAQTIKPVVFGLAAAALAGVPRRAALITGLGYPFTEGPELGRRIARVAAWTAYRLALPLAQVVTVENPDDREFLRRHGLTPRGRDARLVDGSGVDLARYRPTPLPDGPPTAVMVTRLLRDKGVHEFAEAARIVRRRAPGARLRLVGDTDGAPASVRRDVLEGWVAEGLIDWVGWADDVRPLLADSHVFVLPSYYREGVPVAAMEAMAMGRAIITTDAPGCRETVRPGENGWLVPPRDSAALAEAILAAFGDRGRLAAMGARSRQICEARFDAAVVADATISIVLGAASEARSA
ncbi:MAG: glycosyltransferase family 4 protein [Caulobacterales bacterium]